MRRFLAPLLAASVAAPLAAQQADSTTFVVSRGGTVIATETSRRVDVTLKGTLVVSALEKPQRLEWSAVTAPDGTMPLVEVTVKEGPDTGKVKPRIIQRARVIFRGDSASVDAMTNGGLVTKVYGTQAGAAPYLNLSFGLLEQAVRGTGAPAPRDIPFFNLGGGQTIIGKLTRGEGRRWALQVGSVTFDLDLDDQGRLVRAAIPAQELVAERS